MLDTTNCTLYLDEVQRTADAMGIRKKLDERLEWLAAYACHDGDMAATRCKLYKDFAPLSFEFRMERREPDGSYRYWFNGGVIYHGPDCPGDGSFPSLSVDLSGDDTPHWGIHT